MFWTSVMIRYGTLIVHLSHTRRWSSCTFVTTRQVTCTYSSIYVIIHDTSRDFFLLSLCLVNMFAFDIYFLVFLKKKIGYTPLICNCNRYQYIYFRVFKWTFMNILKETNLCFVHCWNCICLYLFAFNWVNDDKNQLTSQLTIIM